MAIYQGAKTVVDVDWDAGYLRVYCAKTGKIMYQTRIRRCAS